MNRENALLYLPLIQALQEGRELQHNPSASNVWYDGSDWSFCDPPERYRVKPKTIRIGAFDVPEPLRVKPEEGSMYYYPDLSGNLLTDGFQWEGDQTDDFIFSRGLAHATKEAAELHARALISLTKTPAAGCAP